MPCPIGASDTEEEINLAESLFGANSESTQPVSSPLCLCLPQFPQSDVEFFLAESNPESSDILVAPYALSPLALLWILLPALKLGVLRSHWMPVIGGAWTAAWKPGGKLVSGSGGGVWGQEWPLSWDISAQLSGYLNTE